MESLKSLDFFSGLLVLVFSFLKELDRGCSGSGAFHRQLGKTKLIGVQKTKKTTKAAVLVILVVSLQASLKLRQTQCLAAKPECLTVS
ncbi:MAG: hypothetical protein Tsb0021_15250 [Chlamydiales bacterium]